MSDKNVRTFDKRTYGRYIEKGLVKGSDVDAHLKSLPDETANATWVELDLDEAELSHSDESLDDTLDGATEASASGTGEEGA